MYKMNITICEDDEVQRKLVGNYCREWCQSRHVSITVKTYSSAKEFLFKLCDEKSIDLLLLDIQMKNTSGIELAEKLKELKYPIPIIFVTAFKDYVFTGYKVDAIDYILKPIDKTLLFNAMDKAYKNINTLKPVLLLQESDYTLKIDLNDILYLESQSHNTLIYTTGTVIKSKSGISWFEDSLNNTLFCKCHRCYLINLSKVQCILKKEVVLDNGTSIPISRGRWADVNKSFLDYCRRSL